MLKIFLKAWFYQNMISLEKLIRNSLGFPKHSQVRPQWDDCCFYRADLSFYVKKVFMRKSVYIRVCRGGEYLLIDPNIIPNDCSCLRLSYLNIDDKIKILHCTVRLHFLVDCDFCSFWKLLDFLVPL